MHTHITDWEASLDKELSSTSTSSSSSSTSSKLSPTMASLAPCAFSCTTSETSFAISTRNFRPTFVLSSKMQCIKTMKAHQMRSHARPVIKAIATTTPTPTDATAATPSPLSGPNQKIRIKLRSFWVRLIEEAANKILDAARSSNARPAGPIRLPTKRTLYCVLKSPHADKDSREHFEKKTFRRLIDIHDINPQTIDALMQIDFPYGVDVEVKLP